MSEESTKIPLSPESLEQEQQKVLEQLQYLIDSQDFDSEAGQSAITFITAHPPDFVTEAIFTFPPTVKGVVPTKLDVLPASPDHIQQSVTPIDSTSIAQNQDETQYIDEAIDYIRDYIQAPRISDSFGNDHDSRTIWKKGIINTLDQIDKAILTPEDYKMYTEEDTDLPAFYSNHFNKFLKRNQYGSNFMNNVGNGINNLTEMVSNSLKPELTQLYQRFKALQIHRRNQSTNPDKLADQVCQIALETLTYLSKPS